MADEKQAYNPLEDPPIPTYEQATTSHPPSRRGPQEVSDDAERQTLLGHDLAPSSSHSRRRTGYYHPPSVQSARSSLDNGSEHGSPVEADEETELRQTMEEMEILDPASVEDGRARRQRTRSGFSKRFYSLTTSLSSLHLPRIPWPSSGWTWVKSRLPTIPEEYKPGWAIVARLCGLIVIVSVVYMLVVSEIVPMGGGGMGAPFNPEWVRQTATQYVDARRIEKSLEYLTSYDHVAGTQGSWVMGNWIEGKLKDAHMDTYTHDEYYVYLNYPKKGGRRVAIVDPPEKRWEAKLEEDSVYNPARAQTQAFHALSVSANVTGPLIYANRGNKEDYKVLWDSQVDLEGVVALVRYDGTQSDLGLKIKAAQNAGVVGVITYPDPADGGFKKGDVWPKGKWRPEDSVQRGSAALTNVVLGDVLTPGRASAKGEKRYPLDNHPALPQIPSIPISWKQAQKLLQSLQGIGQELQDEWTGGVPDVGDVWWSGHPEKSPTVHVQNFQDEVQEQRITNVFGSLLGDEDRAKKIIVGSHRDSWCFGAADPGSGTSIMLEVARVLGELRLQGWRPLRTIEFASWDAKEYNMMGSTEHVEANLEELRANALAYINVDTAVAGNQLWADASPLFGHAWSRVLDRVADPWQNKSLLALWREDGARIGPLSSRSDYIAFQDLAGCSSIDFGFRGAPGADMSGSCYETFEWLSQYVDPGFVYHSVLAQVLVLLILELAQEPIMPLKLDDYAAALGAEVKSLIAWVEAKGPAFDVVAAFDPLVDAVRSVGARAKEFQDWETSWYNTVYGSGGFETQRVTVERVRHNARMAGFESDLLDLPHGEEDEGDHGLPGRDQYKHVVYAPNAYGPDAAVFPFIRDAVEQGDWALAEKQIQKTATILQRAGERLLR